MIHMGPFQQGIFYDSTALTGLDRLSSRGMEKENRLHDPARRLVKVLLGRLEGRNYTLHLSRQDLCAVGNVTLFG